MKHNHPNSFKSKDCQLCKIEATAPDLLEACKKAKTAFETLEKWGKVPMQVVMLKYGILEMEAAIQKATGEKG